MHKRLALALSRALARAFRYLGADPLTYLNNTISAEMNAALAEVDTYYNATVGTVERAVKSQVESVVLSGLVSTVEATEGAIDAGVGAVVDTALDTLGDEVKAAGFRVNITDYVDADKLAANITATVLDSLDISAIADRLVANVTAALNFELGSVVGGQVSSLEREIKRTRIDVMSDLEQTSAYETVRGLQNDGMTYYKYALRVNDSLSYGIYVVTVVSWAFCLYAAYAFHDVYRRRTLIFRASSLIDGVSMLRTDATFGRQKNLAMSDAIQTVGFFFWNVTFVVIVVLVITLLVFMGQAWVGVHWKDLIVTQLEDQVNSSVALGILLAGLAGNALIDSRYSDRTLVLNRAALDVLDLALTVWSLIYGWTKATARIVEVVLVAVGADGRG